MLKRKQITAELVGFECPSCSNGFLLYSDVPPLRTNPKQWLHQCTNCRYEAHLTKPYSMVVYQGKEFAPVDALRFDIEERQITHGNG